MIPVNAITAWSADHPWPTREQVEQDLLLSRSICAIAADDYLGAELVFRGGTALHKMHLDHPYRYSEDLDYVRTSASGIGPLMQALSRLGAELGYTVSTRVSQQPKVYWRTTATSGVPLRIKIEVNTHERSPALPLAVRTFHVDSAWWSGTADVRTFQPAVGDQDPSPMSGGQPSKSVPVQTVVQDSSEVGDLSVGLGFPVGTRSGGPSRLSLGRGRSLCGCVRRSASRLSASTLRPWSR